MSKTIQHELTPISRGMRFLRVSAFLAMVIGVSTQTGTISAYNLDDFMGEMYTNTSGAGFFNAQQRGVITGGSFVARVPIKPINIASFDPPRVSAGCGGINLFGGSFSFINAKELTALLRTVAQNALGLLFQLGINAISQPLSAMLTTWSKKLQDMNSALRNSCEAARRLITLDTSGLGLSDIFKSKQDVTNTNTGNNEDFFSGVKRRFTEGWEELKGNTTADKAAKDDANQGNVAYRAMVESGVHKQIIPEANQGDAQANFEARMLLMNLAGTQVFDASSKPDDSKCTAGAKNCEPKVQNFSPVLEVADLIAPNPKKEGFFFCDSSSIGIDDPQACNKLKQGNLSSYYKGIRFKLNKALYDLSETDVVSREAIIMQIASGKGIVGKSYIPNAASFTTDELAYFGVDDYDTVQKLQPLNGRPELAASVVEKIQRLSERKQAIALGDRLVNAARGMYNGENVKAAKPANFDENLKRFQDDLNAYRNQPAAEVLEPQYVNNYVNMIVNTLEANGMPVRNN